MSLPGVGAPASAQYAGYASVDQKACASIRCDDPDEAGLFYWLVAKTGPAQKLSVHARTKRGGFPEGSTARCTGKEKGPGLHVSHIVASSNAAAQPARC